MDGLTELLTSGSVPGTLDLIERLLLALTLGLVLGLDREYRDKPAGLRSHMLVSLAAASLTIMTFEIVESASELDEAVRVDPLRLMEAVVAGVAFLGAGAIIHGQGTVKGITTGTSLWLAGALGVACGIGLLKLAVITAALAFIVLFIIGWIERRIKSAHKVSDDKSRQ